MTDLVPTQRPTDHLARPELNLHEVEQCLAQYDTAIGPGGDKAWYAGQLARRVPALVAEVKRLRVELGRCRDAEVAHDE